MSTPQKRLERQLVAAVKQPAKAVPEAGRLLWQWFNDLHEARSYGMSGPLPIAYTEIEAYARLHRWPMEPRHIAMLRAMDNAWLEGAYSQQEPRKHAAHMSASQQITASAFDAVFG